MACWLDYLKQMEAEAMTRLIQERDRLRQEAREQEARLRDSEKINERLRQEIRELIAQPERKATSASPIGMTAPHGWAVGDAVEGPPEAFGLPPCQDSDVSCRGTWRITKVANSTFSLGSESAEPSKLASRIIGTPKADDLEQALGEPRSAEELRTELHILRGRIAEDRVRDIVAEEVARLLTVS